MSFAQSRQQVEAKSLRGPRVYSTDLHPDLLGADRAKSVREAVRALKVKLLTCGLVTANMKHLVSPLGLLVVREHPQLLEGGAIVPAFRTDKSTLADYVESLEPYEKVGIDQAQLEEHLSLIETSVTAFMPWDLDAAKENYRSGLIKGLTSNSSAVSQAIASVGGDQAFREALAGKIGSFPLVDSSEVSALISEQRPEFRETLNRFNTAIYHQMGTAVVNCQTGTDLSPLSNFKATDVTLIGRDTSEAGLTDEKIFIRLFMAQALDAIGSLALPVTTVDELDIGQTIKLSEALREQGFQEKYDGVLKSFVDASADTFEAALDKIDPEAIAAAVADLGSRFDEAIGKELRGYKTDQLKEAEARVLEAGADIARDGIGIVPGISEAVAFADFAKHSATAGTAAVDAVKLRDHQRALAAAKQQRAEKIARAIEAVIDGSKRRPFLDAANAMARILVAKIEPA